MNIIKKFTKWITGDRRLKPGRRNHIMTGYKKPNRREKVRRY